jgi:pilus assembly protein CpaB
MNRSRVIVMVAAVVAAGLAALLMRSLLGGGTEKSKAAAVPQIPMMDVLVAANDIPAGTALSPTSARWQPWPKSNVGDTLITRQMAPDLTAAIKGTVARTPLLTGQPLTTANIVHSDAAGFMAAQLSPGMRAISIRISAESGAGGFILPNDRVDILQTKEISSRPRISATKAILRNVRVLAIGQQAAQGKDQKVALGGTATLELTPQQADEVQRAETDGSISLALRPLGDTGQDARVAQTHSRGSVYDGGVAIIRYGIESGNNNPDQGVDQSADGQE